MVRYSKSQIQILQLYREFIKLAKTRPGLADYVKMEFRKNSAIPRANTIQIEQVYRRGQRQLTMLKRQDIQCVGVFTRGQKEDA